MRVRAVFLDRDGTINIEKHFVHKAEDFELIPGSLEALRLLTDRLIDIHIVTNQSGIARGLYTEDQFLNFTQYMIRNFKEQGVKIDSVAYCPHLPDGLIPEYSKRCECRKPSPGMLQNILRKRGYLPEETVLVGDKNSDIEAGLQLGITTYLVLTGYGFEHASLTRADYVKPDLLSAIRHVLGME